MLKELRGASAETVPLATCIFLEIFMDEDNGIYVILRCQTPNYYESIVGDAFIEFG